MVGDVAQARQLVHQAADAAHVLHLLKLVAHVVQVELLALGDLLGQLGGLVLVDLLLHLLDQRQHVAHVEDAAGDTVRMEHVQAFRLFADTDELDRLAGDVAHAQCGAATGITVGLGQHHAGQRQRVAEGLGGVGRVLAGHGVDHEQGFGRIHRRVQGLDLGHHRFVDGQAAGGIDQQYVDERLAGIVDGGADDGFRLLVGAGREEQHAHLLGQGLQLLDRGRTVDVGRDHHHLLLALFLQVLGQLADRGGLAGALQARHQDDGRGGHVEVQVAGFGAHDRGQFVAHHLDQGLARGQRLQHFLADRTHLDALDQGLHHRQRNVGLEQRDAHFAGRLADVLLGQAAAATQALDGAGKALGQGLEHAAQPV